ncbi:hypothetical protein [Acetobacter oeni]|uniref:Uncharacterized protein n=1 Tax=Acetobacter oeni TaxID=304077 RepID=A0A511XPE3_9PROT|nr:hypothetical protein [Acetobacter oeni]MBB3884595.1 hypothetical protein [Acetobacter oeni]NHO20550.1 hypothetical protein [Acetobacter oeni]GBR07514.1 hypothetical protein AA21952_2363 [Acetobacter oeni LMG 21952]GEN64821.1 hypothetical protein AOE01nite_30450 [Acetobacter oeni]
MRNASFGQVFRRGAFVWLQAYTTNDTIRSIYAILCDITLVATMLSLAIQDVEEALAEWEDCPPPVTYETPDRRGAWSRNELFILGQRWMSGDSASEISRLLNRSSGSVSSKRRHLGLPARIRISKVQGAKIQAEKRDAIPADPRVVLTWEEASLLTPEERRGRTWYVRHSLNRLKLTAHKGGYKVRWHEAANIEIAYRHFAFQSPAEIARDFLISESALKSQSSWEQLPPRRGEKTPWFISAKAEHYITEHDYIRRECLCKAGCFFWTTRKGGDRVSRRYRRSVAAIHGIAA